MPDDIHQDETHQPTVEELKAKAYQPMEDAKVLHPFYRGKIETTLKCCIRDFQDFGIWYTPGVAAPCLEIKDDPEKVYEYTNKWNTVAVISDGTRVLGLGDIGPKAGLPVMEGKSLLYKYLGGVDGFPIMVDTKDPDKFIEFVKLVQPGFGGVNLEDIAQPKCFRILDTLREECEIPVWHDDQQGTACVTLAGLINALKVVGRRIDDVRITFVGSGAANVAISRLIFAYGADPAKCRIVDSKGILHKDRADIEAARTNGSTSGSTARSPTPRAAPAASPKPSRARTCASPSASRVRTPSRRTGSRRMNTDPIVFVCANPIPEMWPWDAKEAGAAVVATGRSDFPNQVNNSVGFPGIFRGTLDVRAKTITDEMCMAAADRAGQGRRGQGPERRLHHADHGRLGGLPARGRSRGHEGHRAGHRPAHRPHVRAGGRAEATAIIARARGLVQDQMALGYIPMPEGSKAPAPTSAAVKAAGRGAGADGGAVRRQGGRRYPAGGREGRRGGREGGQVGRRRHQARH